MNSHRDHRLPIYIRCSSQKQKKNQYLNLPLERIQVPKSSSSSCEQPSDNQKTNRLPSPPLIYLSTLAGRVSQLTATEKQKTTRKTLDQTDRLSCFLARRQLLRERDVTSAVPTPRWYSSRLLVHCWRCSCYTRFLLGSVLYPLLSIDSCDCTVGKNDDKRPLIIWMMVFEQLLVHFSEFYIVCRIIRKAIFYTKLRYDELRQKAIK